MTSTRLETDGPPRSPSGANPAGALNRTKGVRDKTRDAAILRTFISSGCRLEELTNLRVDSVNLKAVPPT
jgi:site-specific recombinase XerC